MLIKYTTFVLVLLGNTSTFCLSRSTTLKSDTGDFEKILQGFLSSATTCTSDGCTLGSSDNVSSVGLKRTALHD